MADFKTVTPMNIQAVSPMARTEKLLESIDQKLGRLLALLEKREAGGRP